MARVYSFPPICDANSRALILGSMPGKDSLKKQQYYAHPNNAFWKIMGTLIGAGPDMPYERRTAKLRSHGIALWDVIMSCTPKSSLDSDIAESSITLNNFLDFFEEHRQVSHVYFNGARAEKLYTRYVKPHMGPKHVHVRCQRLPSTSAGYVLPFQKKVEAWGTILTPSRHFELPPGK